MDITGLGLSWNMMELNGGFSSKDYLRVTRSNSAKKDNEKLSGGSIQETVFSMSFKER